MGPSLHISHSSKDDSLSLGSQNIQDPDQNTYLPKLLVA